MPEKKPKHSRWWWLSFADEERFRGCCVVGPTTTDMADAHLLATELGCNPGGEVMGIVFPEMHSSWIPVHMRNRLLTKGEAKSLDRLMTQKLTDSRS